MNRSTFRHAILLGSVVLCLPALAAAQASKSTPVAKDLVAALDAKKLDAIAAKVPGEDDRYVAALYFPGAQLLVICGKYPVPVLLDPKLVAKQFRDVYMELTGTVAKDTKLFVLDMGTAGLSDRKANGFFDTWTQGDKQVVFDGDWDKQKISEADYLKLFTAADEQYTKLLGALLAEAKK